MADVSGEFGINATQAGLYMSAFFAGYLVTQIPGGIMADRYQPKYILIACTILGLSLIHICPMQPATQWWHIRQHI